ncbi:hypothetical protein [Halomicrobium urmianum]|uniref:hypothetical protein n=1 Tax=Halomicrobium urmianum TaxID=1586233 RepID=UPI001CDA406B|nr:hypothetical protein [Halomicrobium urmianum]
MSRSDQTRSRTAERIARGALVGLAVLSLVVSPVAAVAPVAGLQTGDAGSAAQVSDETDRFDVDAEVLGRCGLDCRLVAANVTNVGNETAENVTMTVRVKTSGRTLWRQSGKLGDLRPNETVGRTSTIDVGPRGLYRIQRNDGRIAINATIEWDDGVETQTTRRRVL